MSKSSMFVTSPEALLGQPVKTEMWSVIMTITPQQAKEIMDAQPKPKPGEPAPQRPLLKSNVQAYVHLIRTGQFFTTHQGIAFSREGLLIDGQHRLTACIETNTPIRVQVTFQAERTMFGAIDRGRARAPAHDMVQLGWATNTFDAGVLSSSLRQLYNWDRGGAPWRQNVVGQAGRNALTLDEYESVLAAHPGVLMVLPWAIRFRARRIAPSIMTLAYTLFREANQAKADRFMEMMATGANLDAGHPVLTLREWATKLSGTHETTNRAAATIAMIRAWNAFAAGKQLGRIQHSVRSDEQLPPIVGLRRLPRAVPIAAPVSELQPSA